MREYTKVSPALWQSSRFNSLPSDDGRYLFLYLLTSEYQNSAGCYRLRDGTACDDLQWPKDRYTTARQQLIDADMIAFDPECSVVMVRRWFRHNPPMNGKHATGVERILERLPSELIANAALEALSEAVESNFAKKVAKDSKEQIAAHGAGNGSGSLSARTPSSNPWTTWNGGKR